VTALLDGGIRDHLRPAADHEGVLALFAEVLTTRSSCSELDLRAASPPSRLKEASGLKPKPVLRSSGLQRVFTQVRCGARYRSRNVGVHHPKGTW
jgi:hypothetical protein